ncbi:hypothetical protein AKJ38_04115 [candidate division MSBL1 archaeon SCGC-AAA259I14]|uniref:Protein pelota homolog n=1 Tax=candidate division MSBL1 archaeon SCGC-AAA259I14 TaxID=1698268 RepID=A0A133UPD5_9EURY|nr:hypothetical protein AKJ38_04115 [candidate division MSBL1 archaeon SCGC-AAA259I14]
MRIIYKDLKNNRVKLNTENLNDLWHLEQIISPGDIITSVTWRRPKTKDDKIRPERQEKERVKLSIQVKDVNFHKHSNRLRVLGKIEKGPDLGEHHTINIVTDSKFTLTKHWESDHLERLEEAKKASKRPKVLLIALDDETATFGLVRQYGLEELGEITSTTSGKMYESDRESSEKEYYGEICSKIRNYMENKNIPSVIIAGPGFTKKKIHSLLKEKHPKIAENTHLGNTSNVGKSGLNEIIRRGIVKRVSEEDRASLETDLIEEMLEKVSKNGKATYGKKEVEKAAKMGAIEKLLVSVEQLRKDRKNIIPIIERTRNTGGEVYIVSSEHEAGTQLARIGGLGAILRYRIS